MDRDGPPVRDMGFIFTTRMTVVRLSDGSLANLPVPLAFDALKRMAELGAAGYLVAATPRHVRRLAAWHTLFPEAQLWVGQLPRSPSSRRGRACNPCPGGTNRLRAGRTTLTNLPLKAAL